jgi:uncharacterized OB-fold protein
MTPTYTTPSGLYRAGSEGVHLLASKSSTSTHLVFPAEPEQEIVELGCEGALFTWTSQEFPPPSPPAVPDGEFHSYGVGYVEFAEGLLVEGRLTTCDPARLAIGSRMRVITVPFAGGETFAFEPVAVEDSQGAS